MKPIAVSPLHFSQLRPALLALCITTALVPPALAQDKAQPRSRGGAEAAVQGKSAPGPASAWLTMRSNAFAPRPDK